MKPLLPTLLCASALLGAGWLFTRPAPTLAQTPAAAPATPPAPVEVVTAQLQTIAPVQWVPGTVISRHDARVGAELGGVLLEVVEVGTEVQAGTVLARLDTRALRIERDRNRADLERLRTQLEHARRQTGRLEDMGARSAVAAAQLDEARMQRDVLQQEMARAQAVLADTERRLVAGQIRAPFAGTVVERLAQQGEVVNAGSPLLRLVDTRNVEIQARAPTATALHLSAGDRVELRLEGETRASAVRAVVPVGDSGSRQLELRVALTEAAWPVGSAVEVAVPQSRAHEGLAVHRDALILRGDTTYVYRLDSEDKAQRVEVRAGAGIGDQIEVQGALQAGDRVVVRGGERLREGQSVTVLARS